MLSCAIRLFCQSTEPVQELLEVPAAHIITLRIRGGGTFAFCNHIYKQAILTNVHHSETSRTAVTVRGVNHDAGVDIPLDLYIDSIPGVWDNPRNIRGDPAGEAPIVRVLGNHQLEPFDLLHVAEQGEGHNGHRRYEDRKAFRKSPFVHRRISLSATRSVADEGGGSDHPLVGEAQGAVASTAEHRWLTLNIWFHAKHSALAATSFPDEH